jgi:hypothetical protein
LLLAKAADDSLRWLGDTRNAFVLASAGTYIGHFFLVIGSFFRLCFFRARIGARFRSWHVICDAVQASSLNKQGEINAHASN